MVSVLGLLRWRRCRCVPAGVSFDKESQMFYWGWFDQITFWDTVRVFRKEKKSNRRELMDGLIRQLVPVPGGQTRHMNFCCCTRLRGHLYSKPKCKTFFFPALHTTSQPQLGSLCSLQPACGSMRPPPLTPRNATKHFYLPASHVLPVLPFNLALTSFGPCLTAF